MRGARRMRDSIRRHGIHETDPYRHERASRVRAALSHRGERQDDPLYLLLCFRNSSRAIWLR